MDDALRVVCELNECILSGLKPMVADLSNGEIDWRPLPESNTINIIVRHLRIEAQWHLDSLKSGAAMPLLDVSPALQKEIDAVPLDFQGNFDKLEELYTGFLDILRATTLPGLKQRTAAAYGRRAEAPERAHMLGFHQAMHVAMHSGQICTIRNLYRKTRGEPARFFPENPTYPR